MKQVQAAALQSFLRSAKEAARDSAERIVLGNEALDMDSAVSSIAYAYFLTKSDGQLHVPVMNAAAKDYRLKTDVRFALQSAGISSEQLVFVDQLPGGLGAPGQEIHLVDHNKPSLEQQHIAEQVVSVLDHHRDDGGPGERRKVVFPLGSCCTLVAEYGLAKGIELEEGLSRLLLGTILVDTGNLDAELGKTEPLDRELVERLAASAGAPTKEEQKELFERLNEAKYDVSGLTVEDHLRKDYKEFSAGGDTLGMSAVLKDLKEFDVTGLARAVAEYMDDRQLQLLVVQTARHDAQKQFRRQLMVCTPIKAKAKFQAVCDMLQARDELQLRPMAILETKLCRMRAYDQDNIKISRKQMAPLLIDFLAVLNEPNGRL